MDFEQLAQQIIREEDEWYNIPGLDLDDFLLLEEDDEWE